MLDKELIQKIIKVAHKNNKVVVADPKKINLSDYQNSDIITPNQKEITIASGKNYLSEINLIKYAQKIIKENNIKNILITRSEKGMILVNSKYIKKYKAIAKAATDVTGAGDTVIAVLSTMIAAGFEISSAVKISNNAASIVIKKIGTATTSIVELNNLSK
jgi:D-beta-D-heptose 7-phosphate kinase/D-beta-D-heptose 1-phosphate adenosyltransferase